MHFSGIYFGNALQLLLHVQVGRFLQRPLTNNAFALTRWVRCHLDRHSSHAVTIVILKNLLLSLRYLKILLYYFLSIPRTIPRE